MSETPSNPATPPWGSDEDFNAEKAWTLIQNLRSDKEALKTQNDDLASAKSDLEQRVTNLESEVTTATDRATQLEASVAEVTFGRRLDALAHERGLTPDDVSILNIAAGDEEDATKKLDRLAELRGAAKSVEQEPTPDPAQAADPIKPSDEDAVARKLFGV